MLAVLRAYPFFFLYVTATSATSTLSLHDALPIFQLLEQALFRVEPPGGIHEHRVDAAPPGARRRDRVECHRGGILRPSDARHAEPVRPDLQLLAGAGAKRARRGEQPRPTPVREPGPAPRHRR